MIARTAQHASFVLLAEFDIDQGSTLSHEYPYPTGMDEQLLADLMIPDGVHDQSEDWTIFFLNQTPGNTIASIFTPGDEDEESHEKDLLYVLNLVRTKHDKTVKRGAIVKALAICTPHPFIQIFKPILLIALEDYYADPSVECLARLFDAVNAMDISLAPTLSRDEKLVLRVSERKDVFAEKFVPRPKDIRSGGLTPAHQRSGSGGSGSQLSGFHGTRKLSLKTDQTHTANNANAAGGHERTTSLSATKQLRSSSPALSLNSVSEGSMRRRSSDAGSAIWVGERDMGVGEDGVLPNSAKTETEFRVSEFDQHGHPQHTTQSQSSSLRGRKKSMDQMSNTSSSARSQMRGEDGLSKASMDSHRVSLFHATRVHQTRASVRDTHFFETSVSYNGHTLPIKMPLSTFSEEIGDYSLFQLVQTLTSPTATVSGPIHPHLHTAGVLTSPLIVLFNALITQKRIIFMGYGRPAGHVANFVLAACALGSGCGTHLRGFAERAFPYTNLSNKSVVDSVPGFIAGVTNPIYESLPMWDVLCHIDSGKITVHRDIAPPPISMSFPAPPTLNVRGGSVVSLGEEEGKMAASMMMGAGGVISTGTGGGGGSGIKVDQQQQRSGDGKENFDTLFVEDLSTAVAQHFGETMIRARVAEYVSRFIRIAARYEEGVLGSTSIWFPTLVFSETGVSTATLGLGIPQGFGGSLGSGIVFSDESTSVREVAWNSGRIEGWRLTRCYELWQQDFQAWLEMRPIKKMDVHHQVSRLRYAKTLPDGEIDLIMHTMYENVRTHEQIVELLSHLPPYAGGLLPLTFGLFHSWQPIREATVDVINIIRSQPVGNQFVNNLNAFHRFAYIQILETRKREQQAQARQQEQISTQQHQQAQTAQQLFAAATSVAIDGPPVPPVSAKPTASASGSLRSRRETASGFVTHLFGSSGGSSNGHGGATAF